MAGLNDSTFQNAMKINYLGPLNDQVYRSHVLLDRLEKNKDDVSGRFAYVPLISARNPGVGSRRDNVSSAVGAKLPDHGRQSYAAATYLMAQHYGRGSVSGTVNRKSRDSDGAFAKSLDTEMKGLIDSLPDDLNRQVCGIGNGRAASLIQTTQATSTLITCDSRDNFGVRIGDRVHFAVLADGTTISPANGTTVADISFNTDTNTHSVELVAASGRTLTTATDAMYFGSATAMDLEDSSYGNEMFGLRAMVDDGNIGADETIDTDADEVLGGSLQFGNITRDDGAGTTNPFWQSIVKKASGVFRTLTRNLLFETHLQVTAQNGAKANMIELYMSPSMWGTLGMIQVGGRLFNDFTDTVEMGWEFIKVNGSKAFYDRDIHENEIFYLDMESVFLLTQGGYEFLDDDGRILRISQGGARDAWEFSIHRDVQMGARKLRTSAVLGDLTSTMVVTGARY